MSRDAKVLVPLTHAQISELVMACSLTDLESQDFLSVQTLLNDLDKKTLTREQNYIRHKFGTCPACQGDVTGDSVEISGNLASQDAGCHECGAEWTDIYQLVRLTNTEGFDPSELVNPTNENSFRINAEAS